MWILKRIQHAHYLLVLIEKIKEAIDTDNKFGALLTDLQKHLTDLIIPY